MHAAWVHAAQVAATTAAGFHKRLSSACRAHHSQLTCATSTMSTTSPRQDRHGSKLPAQHAYAMSLSVLPELKQSIAFMKNKTQVASRDCLHTHPRAQARPCIAGDLPAQWLLI